MTYLINFIAIDVPHGKLFLIGFSNTFPKRMSSADVGLRKRPFQGNDKRYAAMFTTWTYL